MKALAILALVLPFGMPAGKAPPPPKWTEQTVAGLTLLVGPSKSTVGLGGLTMTMPVRAAGGEGQATVRQGLTRDVTVTVRDCDVKEVAKLFDLPAFLKGKLAGKISQVTLAVRGDAFTLSATGWRVPGDPVSRVEAVGDLKAKTVTAKVWAFGGLLEYSGRLSTGE